MAAINWLPAAHVDGMSPVVSLNSKAEEESAAGMRSKNETVVIAGLLLALLTGIASAVAFSKSEGGSQQDSGNSVQDKSKKLREIAKQRDVEVEGSSGCDFSDISLADLSAGSKGVVYGRILDSKSYFDDSGAPIEHGEVITTEYAVEVVRVVRDRTLESILPPYKAAPAPLITPLKIARNGGVVFVNGRRASVKVKGYEELLPGRQYVFFLNWSPSYRAYNLTACIFGAVMVNDDLSLKPLGASKKLERELRDVNLEDLLKQIR